MENWCPVVADVNVAGSAHDADVRVEEYVGLTMHVPRKINKSAEIREHKSLPLLVD